MAAVLLMLAGCGGSAKDEFSIPIDQAYQKLASSTLDDFKLDRQCGILIHIQPQPGPLNSVIWTVTSSGQRMFDFTANLTRVSDSKTKVTIDISKENNGQEAYDGSQNYFRPAVNHPTRPAIEEAVAAVLEDRPYDPKRLPEGSGDKVCNVQRNGLESGQMHFSVSDQPGGAISSSGRWDNPDERDGSGPGR
jgi:hypothetical protein